MKKDKLIIRSGVIFAVIAVFILFFMLPGVQYKPRGIFLPAKTDVSNLPDAKASQVKFYQYFPTGSDYKVLGTVRAEQHVVLNTPEESQQFLVFVKRLAAKHGANGVVIKLAGKVNPKGPEAKLKHYYFLGTAILRKRA